MDGEALQNFQTPSEGPSIRVQISRAQESSASANANAQPAVCWLSDGGVMEPPHRGIPTLAMLV